MPLYDYKCEKCGRVTEELHRYPRVTSICPECSSASKRIFTLSKGTRSGESREIWSKAMGISPDQIPEMKKRYPDHVYHPETGDLRVCGAKHRDKLAKQLGMEVFS